MSTRYLLCAASVLVVGFWAYGFETLKRSTSTVLHDQESRDIFENSSRAHACPLHVSSTDDDIAFVLDAVDLISRVLMDLNENIRLIAIGASAISMLRFGSIAADWNGMHYYNDGDVDFLALYPNEQVKLKFWSALKKASEESSISDCPYNYCIPRNNMTDFTTPKLMPCAAGAQGQPIGCEELFHKGSGTFKITIDTAYDYNTTHFAQYYSGRPDPWYHPYGRVFPTRMVKLYNTSVFVPKDYMWYFSSSVPYIEEEKWLGLSPEYGRGCFGMAYAGSFLRGYFDNVWTFDDDQLEHIRTFERSLVNCAFWLEEQGFGSFSDCFKSPRSSQ